MLIVGSQALNHHAQKQGIGYRKPTDLDINCTEREMVRFAARHGQLDNLIETSKGHWIISQAPEYRVIEFEIIEHCKSDRMYEMILGWDVDYMAVYGEKLRIATVPILYSMKRSHRHFPRQWHKHIADYHLLKKMVGGVDIWENITKQREAETKERFGLKTPSLNKKTEEFFDDTVSNKVFIHDEIHAVMAHYDAPLYERIKVDPNLVKCSKEKFYALTEQERIECVLEEAYVIALERAIIPMLFSGGPLATADKAIQWSLMRICTTLTSGWFRDYATENYPAIYGAYSREYVDKFLRAVQVGRIERIKHHENEVVTQA